MRILLKYMNRYWKTIVLIVLITFAQAIGFLALPNYMSNIVNIGIQQKGIDGPLPRVLDQKTLDQASLMMTDQNAAHFRTLYVPTLKQDWTAEQRKLVSAASEETLYFLDEEALGAAKKEKGPASEFQTGWLLYALLSNDNLNQFDGRPVIEMSGSADQKFNTLSGMSEQERGDLLRQGKLYIESLPQESKQKMGGEQIATVYGAVGVDMDGLQSAYILREGLVMVVLSIVVMGCAFAVVYYAARVAAGVGRDLRNLLFQKVVHFSDAEYDQYSTTSLINRCTNDIQQVQMSLVMVLRIVLYSPILAIGAVIMALRTNVTMSWVILAAVVTVVASITVVFRYANPRFQLMQKQMDNLNLVTRESLTGLLVVRAFHTEDKEKEKFETANHEITDNMLHIARIMSLYMPLIQLIMNFTGIAIVWIGAKQIDMGYLLVGDMMAFLQYSMMTIIQFMFLSMLTIMLPRSLVSVARVDEVIETPISVVDPQTTKAMDRQQKGHLVFRNVSFRYPDAEECAIKDISFETHAGKTTAIIGSTGSGKSTAIKLIPRFYDVTEGSIHLNGTDIREIKMNALRNRIGYVPQQSNLFSGTIRSNLTYGKNGGITQEQLGDAIETSASDFIYQEDGGIDAAVSRGGSNFSGGQKQRLSIARAIATKPELIIFDDSFSALDFTTDTKVRRMLKQNLTDSAILIVAQRISTIKDADEIIVMEDGLMVGKGRHKELLLGCETYRNIAESQMNEEEMARNEA